MSDVPLYNKMISLPGMKKTFWIFIFNLSCLTTFSQVRVVESFANLDSLPIQRKEYRPDNNFIKFDPAISTVYNIESDIPVDYSEDYTYAVGSDNIKLIRTKVDHNSDDYYFITFGSIDGFSIGFTIFEAEAPYKIIGQIQAASLIIPGNGNLYSIDKYWENFETRRKHVLNNGEIAEEKQAFYSVDLKSYALRPITIYSDIEMRHKIATIPVNGSVEIILCTDSDSRSDTYLIRTSFGLIGWAKLKAGQYRSVDVEGLYYNGD